MKKERDIKSISVKWNKNFAKEMVEKYQYGKVVFLDEENEQSIDILQKVQLSLVKNKINKNNLTEALERNTCFQYDEKVDFNIRALEYWCEEDNIRIANCKVLFLEENEFLKRLNSLQN